MRWRTDFWNLRNTKNFQSSCWQSIIGSMCTIQNRDMNRIQESTIMNKRLEKTRVNFNVYWEHASWFQKGINTFSKRYSCKQSISTNIVPLFANKISSDLPYIITRRLQQDILENFFAYIKGMSTIISQHTLDIDFADTFSISCVYFEQKSKKTWTIILLNVSFY